MFKSNKLSVGDWIEVRSKEEILRTLDGSAQLEGIPFMPQMFQYCGKRFQVYKRAHKTCDTINPVRSLRIKDTVHLDLRCDGAVYGGCQSACLLFWKTAWLKRMDEGACNLGRRSNRYNNEKQITANCTEADVWESVHVKHENLADGLQYRCQATQVSNYGVYLPWWDFRQYFEDYRSGNASLRELSEGLIYASYSALVEAGIGLGPPLRWIYDVMQSIRGGLPYPKKSGRIASGQRTPLTVLNLQPGETVRVKSHKAILATLDTTGRNRGLGFDGDMMPFCNRTYRVKARVEKFIDEKTGRLSTVKQPAITLEGVACRASYSWCRMFCPRSVLPWWRETWLERISADR